MLQRAAKNAYSWWWASHIRTKQSKWLEQNIKEMEEKVDYILKIIDGDGDSFARRAESYFRKRPELLNFVEDTFRSYRALAERYDHLSRDLQNANRTIASVCPERVPMSMYDEDGDIFLPASSDFPNEKISTNLPPAPKLSIPKILSMMKKSDNKPGKLMSKKGLLKFNADNDNAIQSSGLSKEEALVEIDKLQKQILAVQTEKEFVKSSYELQLAKYWEFEDRVAEMQAKVYSLQDEFGIGTCINDNEARNVMTSSALKSCRETLGRLQEQKERLDEAAEVKSQRVQNARLKFESLLQILKDKIPLNLNMEQRIESSSEATIKEHSQTNTSTHLTMSELAEKVDEVVEKVINLEILTSSQNAQINSLRTATDEFLLHLQNIEDEKETLIEDSESTCKKIRELDEELRRVMNLDQAINSQSNSLQTHISEASCMLQNLSVQLQNVQPDEEIYGESPSSVAAGTADEDSSKIIGQNIKLSASSPDLSISGLLTDDPLSPASPELLKLRKSVTFADSISRVLGIPETGVKKIADQSISDILGDEVNKQKDINDQENVQNPRTQLEGEEPGTESDKPEWRELNINCSDDREKVLLDEYISVLRNYKEAKKKLNEAEKQRRASHFQYVIQIKVLKNSNASKDAEIQSLKKKLASVKENHVEMSPHKATSEAESLDVHMRNLMQLIDVPTGEEQPEAKPLEETTKGDDLKQPQTFSTIEEKICVDIDELLEENIELWLRFSTAFHQIEKFHKSVQDLEAELQKARDKSKNVQDENRPSSLLSEVRPIYKHMREIQTEFILWLEHTAVLKEDLKHRLSSLSSIQDEILRLSKEDETQLSAYQAAKFQGEILNMKQENNKVANELQAGVESIKKLQADVTRTLMKLDEELGIKEITATARSKIPMTSFLFGKKLKKQIPSNLLARVNPALMQKKVIDLPRLK